MHIFMRNSTRKTARDKELYRAPETVEQEIRATIKGSKGTQLWGGTLPAYSQEEKTLGTIAA